ATDGSAAGGDVGTPIIGNAVFAINRRVAIPEEVLRDTGLDQPMIGRLLVGGALTPVAARRADDVATEVGMVVVALDEQAGRHVHRRQGEAPDRDVGLVADEGRSRRIDHTWGGNVGRALVADRTREAEALELVGIADHRAPVITSLGDRRGVDEPIPARAVIAHQLGTARVVRGRIGDARCSPYGGVELTPWTANEEAAVDQAKCSAGRQEDVAGEVDR